MKESRQSRQALHRQDPTIGEGRPSGLPLLPHSLSFIFRSCNTGQDPPGFTGEEGTPRSERCQVCTWPPQPEQAARTAWVQAFSLHRQLPAVTSMI